MALDVSDEELHSLQSYAATVIQSRWRGYLVRTKLCAQGERIPHHAPNAGFAMRRRSAIQRDSMPQARFAHGRVVSETDVAKLYKISSQILGEGEFALVKLATNVQTQQQAAAKMINKTRVLWPPERDLMLNEILTLQRLDHPHCVGLLDVMETSEHVLLFLEYLSEGDLFDRLSHDGPFSEADACGIIRDTLSGLAVSWCAWH